MKCKSWSNKINNFVVRRLKSIKSNGPQQQQLQLQQPPSSSNCSTSATNNIVHNHHHQQPHSQQQQPQQQQYITNCCNSTMPAMPKEKATAVSLTENNFSELKYKELATSAAVVAATAASAAAAAMATTAAAAAPVVTSSPLATAGVVVRQQQNSSSSIPYHHNSLHNHHHQQQQQQQHHHHQQQRHLCGCGNASAATEISTRTKYSMTNGHSSPLAAAMASGTNSSNSPSSSPHRSNNSSNSSTCCRLRFNNQNTTTTTATDYNNTPPPPPPQYNTSSSYTLSSTSSVSSNASSCSVASSTTNTNNTLLNPNSSSTTPPLAVTPPKKSPKDFFFGKFIGEGSFSNVYLGVDTKTKREYAIKVCEKRQILREHKQEYIRREREVMHMMTNVPGFVNLSCTFQDTRSLYFVMTYAKNGDLLPYINKVGSFDVDSTRHYAAELVLACEQMHRRNIVHRDLKPENILLDEDMHTLIADFGSVKILNAEERQQANYFLMSGGLDLAKKSRSQSGGSVGSTGLDYDDDDDVLDSQNEEDEANDSSGGSSNDTGSGGDEVDSPRARRQQPRYHRKRRGSFVGTAQYVSPEVLQNSPITPAADLWALGCIIYQMMSGLPPFRGANDYVIFKEILACNLDFPQGFDRDAEDLVKKLLKLNPAERLGAQDFNSHYESIRSHPFFKSIDFDTVRQQTPPPISPFLPDLIKEEEDFKICENLEPGLDEKQMTRLLGMELGCISDDDVGGVDKKKTANNNTTTTTRTQKISTRSSNSCSSNSSASYKSAKNSFDLTDAEKHKRLEAQKTDKWHAFADGEVILKKGFINKRKGLFARRRMFLLCTGPRLIYIDPVQMVKKGEIPWSPELRAEAKNFKIFFVHTPNRTYYLDDPEGFGLEWVAAIEKMHTLTYNEQINTSTATSASATPTPTPSSCNNRTSSNSSCNTSTSKSITKTTIPTPHKTSSLLTKPITILKTASN